jgi:CRP/FNR family transcriptional regulator, nitrogen fixation regulation protein
MEGEPATHWYWLASGAVQVCSFAEDGKRQVAELVLPGDFFGIEACGRRGATAEAARDAVVIAYPRARAEAVVDGDPRLARAFREVACGRLHHAQACLFRLGKMSALARVASFLLEMGERCRRGADGVVDVPVTRDDIADYLGLTSETVSRALTRLRRRGAIALRARQSIHLADRAALASAKDARR